MRFTVSAVLAALAVSSVNALVELNVVKQITVNITLTSLVLGSTKTVFVASNPVDFPLSVNKISVIAGEGTDVYATINTSISLNLPASIPPNVANVTSPVITATNLTKGIFGSIGLLLAPTIDIFAANLSVVAYKIPITLGIFQNKVPLKVNLDLLALSKRDAILAREAYGRFDHVNIL